MSWTPWTRLDYLDLASRYPATQILTTDQNPHICYFSNRSVLHSIHSESAHLNSITDILLSIGIHLDKQITDSLTTLEALMIEGYQQNQLLKDLNQNIEYLKNSQENLNLRFSQTNFLRLPLRKDVTKLSQVIEENKPREFEIQHKDLLAQVQKLVIQTEEKINFQIDRIYKTLEELKSK